MLFYSRCCVESARGIEGRDIAGSADGRGAPRMVDRHIKRILASVGLPSSPYSSLDTKLPNAAKVLGNVMRNLNLDIFFTVDFSTGSGPSAPYGRRIVYCEDSSEEGSTAEKPLEQVVSYFDEHDLRFYKRIKKADSW
ncbi:hypothetical protein HPB50_007440 [Hyalomma asiaticum]|uniref:Uncharacterized protein n=1 Tax=Hyalomma asiaticum TaxID=266040 RepID=A0ACB7RRM3_HYAAI|nr:hypothetical protein HPB50_007440 [Hyalomma asiaticum]